MQHSQSQRTALWIFLAYFFTSLFMLGWLLWPIVSVLVMAAVVTGVFSPVYRLMRIKDKVRPALASLITCLIIIVVLFIPTMYLVSNLSREVYELYVTVRNLFTSGKIKAFIEGTVILDKTNTFLANFDLVITGEELNKVLTDLGKVILPFMAEQARAVADVAANLLMFVANFFFVLIVVFYLLKDGQRLVEFILKLSPLPKDQEDVLVKKFKDMTGAVIIGNGLAGLVQGIAGGMLFFFFGIKAAFLWGIIMAVLAFLPILGIGIILVPTAVFMILQGHFGTGIVFIVFYVIVAFGIEYLIKPKVVGQRVKMHTLLVFLSIIGGLKVFGVMGIIYGPLIITAFLTLTEIYYASYQKLVDPTVTSERGS